MLIQKLTLICASVSIALLTACGGANMSGAISPRKEKTDKSGAKDASAPAIVTGAYLTCNYSPTDATSGNNAVGCSVIDGGSPVIPDATNKLAFYRSVNNGPYLKPNKNNTSSGHQAVFTGPKVEINSSRYLAMMSNQYGMDEFRCDSLPCNSPITMNAKPSFVRLDINSLWRMDNSVNSAINAMPFLFNYIDASAYCDASGQAKIGSNPALNFIRIPTVGATKIESQSLIYADTSNFRKHKLKNGTYREINDGCIIVPLKRNGKNFRADGISKSGPEINTERFDLILSDTPSNRTLVDNFLQDIP
jgi:hypothetical protein